MVIVVIVDWSNLHLQLIFHTDANFWSIVQAWNSTRTSRTSVEGGQRSISKAWGMVTLAWYTLCYVPSCKINFNFNFNYFFISFLWWENIQYNLLAASNACSLFHDAVCTLTQKIYYPERDFRATGILLNLFLGKGFA